MHKVYVCIKKRWNEKFKHRGQFLMLPSITFESSNCKRLSHQTKIHTTFNYNGVTINFAQDEFLKQQWTITTKCNVSNTWTTWSYNNKKKTQNLGIRNYMSMIV